MNQPDRNVRILLVGESKCALFTAVTLWENDDSKWLCTLQGVLARLRWYILSCLKNSMNKFHQNAKRSPFLPKSLLYIFQRRLSTIQVCILRQLCLEHLNYHIILLAQEQTEEELVEEMKKASVICIVYSIDNEVTIDKVCTVYVAIWSWFQLLIFVQHRYLLTGCHISIKPLVKTMTLL